MTENHEDVVRQLSKQVVVIKIDIHELQERTKILEAQLNKIAESQTLILAQLREN
jgi:proteasome assembly chaperone (PAC2) family protein